MKTRTLRITLADNIEVALDDLAGGETIFINGKPFVLWQRIPAKHKFAAKPFAIGDDVMMYGVLVGKATGKIEKGELITINNIRHASNGYQVKERKTQWQMPDTTKWQQTSFMGYHRENGEVGTANYWLVIPLVFCENINVLALQEAFNKELGYQTETSPYRSQVKEMINLYRQGKTAEDILTGASMETLVQPASERIFPNIDGIKFLTHTMGCGGTKEDAADLCGLLAGYISHANVAGATVLSLGCQNAQPQMLLQEIKKRDAGFNKPLFILEQQKIGNETLLLQEAVKQTFTGLMQANKLERKPAPLSKLIVGLECGGSDGFSGITANPALGYVSDLLVALQASVILAEFPELCGVEQELSDRCATDALAGKFVSLMSAYQKKALLIGSGFDSNPSAGNIKDGLITDAIKSAGAAKKGGTSPITDVLDYPQKLTTPGLNLLCTPGSDIESTTAEVAAGANLVLFTTGLGTPTGNPIAPVVKISTNTLLYNKMKDIIDIDAGCIVGAEETIEEVGERMLAYIIKVASGDINPKATLTGHDDFIPWKRGISL